MPVTWTNEKPILLYCPDRGSNSRPSAHRGFKHGQGDPRPYSLRGFAWSGNLHNHTCVTYTTSAMTVSTIIAELSTFASSYCHISVLIGPVRPPHLTPTLYLLNGSSIILVSGRSKVLYLNIMYSREVDICRDSHQSYVSLQYIIYIYMNIKQMYAFHMIGVAVQTKIMNYLNSPTIARSFLTNYHVNEPFIYWYTLLI